MNARTPKYSASQVPSVPELIAFEAIARVDHTDTLRSIRVPIIFSHGQLDQTVLPQSAVGMASNLPGSEVTIYKESSHAPFVTEAALFNANLVALLKVTKGKGG